jgi:hypothetical protein
MVQAVGGLGMLGMEGFPSNSDSLPAYGLLDFAWPAETIDSASEFLFFRLSDIDRVQDGYVRPLKEIILLVYKYHSLLVMEYLRTCSIA